MLRSVSTRMRTPDLTRPTADSARLSSVSRQGFPVPAFRELDGKPGGRETGLPNIAEAVEFFIRNDGARHLDQPGVLRRFFQNVGMVAYVCSQAHDQFLPDGVDGRIGHLGKQLLEIIEQERRLSGEDGQRRVISHGAERLRAFQHHGADNQLHILLSESKLRWAAHEVRGISAEAEMESNRERTEILFFSTQRR